MAQFFSTRYRWIVISLLAALAIVTIVALMTASKWSRHYATVVSVVTARVAGVRPVNILLIANNARDVAASNPLGLGSAAGQADVILLAHFDPATNTVSAITVPRDTLVAQPHWHNTVPKIKTLFFMGDQETPPRGPEYLAKAVAKLTGLPVDGYIVSNFASFKETVDVVGGLTIDVKQRIYDPQDSHADFQPGVQHMNGSEVLAFVRVRQNHAGNSYRVNDFQRMQAEVQVLGLLRDRILDPRTVARLLPPLMSRMSHDLATNLPKDRLVRIGIAMAGARVYQVPLGTIADSMQLASANIAGINADGRIDSADYDVLDASDVKSRLAEFGSRSSTTGLPLPRPGAIPIELYCSAHTALHFEHLGFRRAKRRGDATGENTVIYPAAFPSWGWQAARGLGTGSVLVEPGDVVDVVVRE
jgi:LCP family protein required for cell wall assembly